ncbi:hypothetical protein YT1_p20032 (plasmid) [Rhodococcus ruber]|nr:hypothetical protein YT1_p20032 [Rhodococcus ruber]
MNNHENEPSPRRSPARCLPRPPQRRLHQRRYQRRRRHPSSGRRPRRAPRPHGPHRATAIRLHPHGARSHVGGREQISPTVAVQVRRYAFIEGSHAALVGVEWNADHRRYELTESGRVVMFGGNYAGTSDSRLGELSERYLGHRSMILPVHDRIED